MRECVCVMPLRKLASSDVNKVAFDRYIYTQGIQNFEENSYNWRLCRKNDLRKNGLALIRRIVRSSRWHDRLCVSSHRTLVLLCLCKSFCLFLILYVSAFGAPILVFLGSVMIVDWSWDLDNLIYKQSAHVIQCRFV